MNLSKRLEAVATLVDVGKRVIDVGCDHAYLDIYLTENNENICIATDINKNAIQIAKKNVKAKNLEEKIQVIQTDGLENIDVKSEDNIVISGMGTFTILHILETNNLSNTLIISSNNDIELLRKNVINLGYKIDTEIFLFDKGIPYIIIKFIRGYKKYSKRDIRLGPILKNNIESKAYLIKKYKTISKKVPKYKIFIKIKYKFKTILLKLF